MTEAGLAALDARCSDWSKKLQAEKPFSTVKKSLGTRDLRRPVQELNRLDPNTPTDGERKSRHKRGFFFF